MVRITNSAIFALAMGCASSAIAQDTIVSGYIESRSEAVVKAATTGEIRKVHRQFLDDVAIGAPVVQIRCTVESAQIRAATARLNKARAEYNAKKIQHNQGAVAQYELDVAKADVAVSSAEKQVQVSTAKKCDVAAPIDGTIEALYVKAGSSVEAGDPLFKIVNAKKLYGVIEADQFEWSQFQEGQAITIKVIETNQDLSATIDKKANYIDRSTQRFRMELSLSNTEAIGAGMVFRVTR